MIREKIVKFCEEIKVEYCSYLYNSKKINFPFCCRHSADFITSYLKMTLGDNFTYIGTTNPILHNHAWTEYLDSETQEHFIVDFTGFQYSNYNNIAVLLKEKKLKQCDFEAFIVTQKVVYDPQDEAMYKKEDDTMSQIFDCYGMDESQEWKLSSGCFMEYVKKNFDKVHENTVYL